MEKLEIILTRYMTLSNPNVSIKKIISHHYEINYQIMKKRVTNIY